MTTEGCPTKISAWSGTKCGDRHDVDTIGALASPSSCCDHDEGGRTPVSVGVYLRGEVEEALGYAVDDGLVAGELDLEGSSPARGLYDRV